MTGSSRVALYQSTPDRSNARKDLGSFWVRLVRCVTIVTTGFDGVKPGFQLGYGSRVRRWRRHRHSIGGLGIRLRDRELLLCLILCGEGCLHQFLCHHKWAGRSDHWFERS